MKHIFFLVFLTIGFQAFAQDSSDDNSIDQIENLFKEDADEEDRIERRRIEKKEKKSKKKESPEDLGDLKKLETFDDIAVIQKRFLPKSGRFQAYFAGGTNLNDAFFVGSGISARLGYHFSEKWSLEALYFLVQNDNRDVTNELLERGVTTEGSVSTDGYYGLDLVWTPIYGKYAYFDEKIIPFDLYFSVGLGQTDPKIVASATGTTVTDVESDYTVKFGTGQIFALTKWMAFRWDISLHLIDATSTTRRVADNVITNEDSSQSSNLFLNVGLSFFFPEASYR